MAVVFSTPNFIMSREIPVAENWFELVNSHIVTFQVYSVNRNQS